jgi:alkylated DNA nucleotide flippase Atl1
VVRADGSVAEPVRVEQLGLLAAEGVPVRSGRVDLAAVAWP